MLFCVLNYLLRHHLALEPPQRAFDRLTLINSNYRHSFSAFLFIRSEATAYLTRRQRPRSSAQSLRWCLIYDEMNPADSDLFAGFSSNYRLAKPILLLPVLL